MSAPKPTRDTVTGEKYPSRYAAGKALGPEFGLSGQDRFDWFRVVRLATAGRFVDIKTNKVILYDGRLAKR